MLYTTVYIYIFLSTINVRCFVVKPSASASWRSMNRSRARKPVGLDQPVASYTRHRQLDVVMPCCGAIKALVEWLTAGSLVDRRQLSNRMNYICFLLRNSIN